MSIATYASVQTVLVHMDLASFQTSLLLYFRNVLTLYSQSHISSQLLYRLQKANDDPIWDDDPDLLLWLLYIGGAFAPPGIVRSGYVVLLHTNKGGGFGDVNKSWTEVLDILEQFIWSQRAFLSPVKAFWEEAFAPDGPVYVPFRIVSTPGQNGDC
jgi:hypothetical protein